MGLYVDTETAEQEAGPEVDCLPAMSPEHNEALAEREHLRCHPLLYNCSML